MQTKITAGVVTGLAVLAAMGGVAAARQPGGGSRLDDGKDLLGQASSRRSPRRRPSRRAA